MKDISRQVAINLKDVEDSNFSRFMLCSWIFLLLHFQLFSSSKDISRENLLKISLIKKVYSNNYLLLLEKSRNFWKATVIMDLDMHNGKENWLANETF